MIRHIALAMLAVSLVACGGARRWYIPESQPIHAALGDVGDFDITMLKQQTDFVHVIATIRNRSGSKLYFRPVDGSDKPWGVNLRPLNGSQQAARNRRNEMGIIIEKGDEAHFNAQWFIKPEASSDDWKWEITVDGLMCGDREIPTIVIPMPAYVAMPAVDSGKAGRAR